MCMADRMECCGWVREHQCTGPPGHRETTDKTTRFPWAKIVVSVVSAAVRPLVQRAWDFVFEFISSM